MIIRLSDLNTDITLEYPTRISDEQGGFTNTWTSAGTVKAKVYTLRSDDAIVAMMTSNAAIHSVTIRYRADIRGSWRIKYVDRQGTHYWTIIGPPIDLNKEHRWLELKVKETM